MVWCFCKCTDAFRTNKDYMTNLIGNVLTGSCYKRNRCSGCNDICLFSNDICEWNQWEAGHRDSRCMWWQVYQIFRIQEDLWYTQCVLWKEYRLLCPIPLKNCNDSDHGWEEEASRFLSFDNIYFQISNCSSWMSLLLSVHQRCWIWICLLRGTARVFVPIAVEMNQ